jgi:hypothetical protein
MITNAMVGKVYDRINFQDHGPEGIAEGLAEVFRDHLAELLDGADLEAVQAALVRERVIRQVMDESGEERQHVADMMDAMASVSQEGVEELTGGQPTTLRDTLHRYVDDLATRREPSHEIGGVMADLAAILAYPFPGPSVELEIVHRDEDHLEVRVGGMFLFSAVQDDHGRAGLKALENASRAVHREVVTRLGSA